MKPLSAAFVLLSLRLVGGALGAAIAVPGAKDAGQVPLSVSVHEYQSSPESVGELDGGGVLAQEEDEDGGGDVTKPKKLHGRFLHITDIHPDGHYRPHTAESRACHRKNPKNKKKNDSGYYGSAYSDCDSSFRLANFTLDYIEKNWANEVDFVVWTGDSARHDNDHSLPRTPDEIFDLNRAVTAKMEKIFVRRGIPVVPSLGNNDIWPHNIMAPGPNRVTTEFLSIWESFIPFTYRQVFHRGAYYARTIIPDELAIISLNTLYFYDSNKVVNGCPWGEDDDPGNLELDWLEVRLETYHQHGMKVYVTGHVPPSPGNYFPECFVRYAELALRYQNVILGHLFGHMNIDHFFFLESIDLDIIPEGEKQIRVAGNDLALYDTLLEEYSALPKGKKTNYDEYAVVNVAPSVVPDYLPSFRIYSYNNTEGVTTAGKKKKHPTKPPKRKHGRRRGERGEKAKKCKEAKYRDSWKCHLDEPWNSDEDAPSRRNSQWTVLGYAQYNMPNLDEANKTVKPVFELEYVTFPVEMVETEIIPLRHLPEELKQAALEGGKSKFAPYSLPDLTIPSWVKLARRVADEKRVKLRKRFKKFMYGGGY